MAIADALRKNSETIIEANKIDIENGENAGLSKGLIDRLMLDEKRINDIADSVVNVIHLPDPCGITLNKIERPNGLVIKRFLFLSVLSELFMKRARMLLPMRQCFV